MNTVAIANNKTTNEIEVFATLEAAVAEYEGMGYVKTQNLNLTIENGQYVFGGYILELDTMPGLIEKNVVEIVKRDVK